MERFRARRIIFGVTLFIMFFFVATFLGLKIYSIYTEQHKYFNETAGPSIDCLKFVYYAEDVSYDGKTVRFKLINKEYSEPIKELVIEGTEKKVLKADLVAGDQRMVEIELGMKNNTFFIYPKECSVYKNEVRVG